MTDFPRLIEHAFPLKQASLDSVHEKNVRHGHISTLHIWPARRPLAACRAALIATLLPDPSAEPKPAGMSDAQWEEEIKRRRKALCEKIGGKVVKKIEKKKMPNGQIVERYTYDPYGKTVIEETNPATGLPTARLEASAFGNPFAWTGQRYDAGVRLYHFLFRGYSPQLGRWLQRDPLDYVDGPSLYEYVRSRVLGSTDPLGLDDYDKEIIRQQGRRDQARILIGGGAAAAGEVLDGVGKTMVVGVIIAVPGPDDVAIGIALGTKIGSRVAGLLGDALKGKKVEKVGK